MHINIQRERATALRSDRARLEQVESLARDVRARHEGALALVASAQERATMLAAELVHLEAQTQILNSSIGSLGAAFSRDFFAACPEELLLSIFKLLSDEPDEEWPVLGRGAYNFDRACLPFDLSAVCRRWRQVSVSCSSLWTYVGLPGRKSSLDLLPAHRDYIQRILTRSGSAPLDVMLPWSHYIFDDSQQRHMQGNVNVPEEQVAQMYRIFAILTEHAERWAKVEIWLPRAFDIRLFDVFRGPMPALTELAVIPHAWDNSPTQALGDDYLPFAPRLSHLLLGCGIMCPETVPSGTLPRLVTLEFYRRTQEPQISHTVSRCSSTLETLQLHSAADASPDVPVTLPLLRTLRLFYRPYFAREGSPPLLVAPRLENLTLGFCPDGPKTALLISAISSTVTYLTLHGRITASHFGVLSGLQNLTHFAVAEATYGLDYEYSISNTFFTQLAEDTAVWPKLRSISLLPCGTISDDEDAAADGGTGGTDILRVITSRNGPGRVQGEEQPCRLQEVVLQYDGVPQWLVAEAARLISA